MATSKFDCVDDMPCCDSIDNCLFIHANFAIEEESRPEHYEVVRPSLVADECDAITNVVRQEHGVLHSLPSTHSRTGRADPAFGARVRRRFETEWAVGPRLPFATG